MEKGTKEFSLTWTDGTSLRELKMRILIEVLKSKRGIRGQAARSLGISLRAIRMWIIEMNKSGIEVPKSDRSKR